MGHFMGRRECLKERLATEAAMQDVCAVILAAGEGTRMRSRTAKVLHPLDHIMDEFVYDRDYDGR